jgi:predicted NUDIX family NTP pyrophosphohydrolase
MSQSESAGLLLYRRRGDDLEVLLAHPGGPFWARKDAGAWTIPKGLINDGEHPMGAARREFAEETGLEPTGRLLPLGRVRQKAGKIVHAWAAEGDADPDTLRSNLVTPASGTQPFAEIDRYGWFGVEEAKHKLNPAQAELVDRLIAALTRQSESRA